MFELTSCHLGGALSWSMQMAEHSSPSEHHP